MTSCEISWVSLTKTRTDAYRQHRCRLTHNHEGNCKCRYCGSTKGHGAS